MHLPETSVLENSCLCNYLFYFLWIIAESLLGEFLGNSWDGGVNVATFQSRTLLPVHKSILGEKSISTSEFICTSPIPISFADDISIKCPPRCSVHNWKSLPKLFANFPVFLSSIQVLLGESCKFTQFTFTKLLFLYVLRLYVYFLDI